jgi:hypothetical protein
MNLFSLGKKLPYVKVHNITLGDAVYNKLAFRGQQHDSFS